jgi:hypothetical protein
VAYCVPISSRDLRIYRLVGATLTLALQRTGPSKLKVSSNAIMLTTGIIWFINGLHSRPDDGRASRDLMRGILPHTENDSNLAVRFQDDEQEEDGEGTVPHAPCGIIFLRDIRLPPDSRVPRMRLGREINDYTHKFFFGMTMRQIVSHLRPIGILTPNDIPATRIPSVKGKTPAYVNLDGANDPLFDLGQAGHRMPSPGVDIGSDLDVEEHTHADNASLDDTLTTIWYQFLQDVIIKAPNPRGAMLPSYCKVPAADRLLVRDAFYQNRKLSDIWTVCQVRVASHDQWMKAFHNLWPPKDHVTGPRAQNYRSCTYYQDWKSLVADLPAETVTAARTQIKKKVDTLYWIPNALNDKMWHTTKPMPGFKVYPPDWQGSAPQLLVRHRLPQWQMPPSTDSGDG